MGNNNYINELIAASVTAELVQLTLLKIGLEFIPIVEPDKVDEIVNLTINEISRGN